MDSRIFKPDTVHLAAYSSTMSAYDEDQHEDNVLSALRSNPGLLRQARGAGIIILTGKDKKQSSVH
jgi:hypothetical protein